MVERSQSKAKTFSLSVNVRIKPIIGNDKQQENTSGGESFTNTQNWAKGQVSVGTGQGNDKSFSTFNSVIGPKNS